MKKIFTAAFAMYFLLAGFYVFFEPEMANADGVPKTEDVSVSLTVGSEISLACADSAPLAGTITAITGGIATGSFSCTVITPDSGGYDVTVHENHKLYYADLPDQRFDDYTPVSGADYAWIPPTSGAEIFGFSLDADTTSAAPAFKNNGSACNQSGSVSDDHCWAGFPLLANPMTVATKTSASTNDKVAFNLKAQAAGNNALLPADYANTVTVTATAK